MSVTNLIRMNTMVRSDLLVLLAVVLMRYIQGEDYIIAMPGNSLIRAVSGHSAGWIYINSRTRYSIDDYSEISVALKSSVTTSKNVIVENKTVLVTTSDTPLNIYGHSVANYFSPLPISALGKRYIVLTCYRKTFKSLLVIAAQKHKTDVNINIRSNVYIDYNDQTYSNGETLSLTLEAYQTFTVVSDNNLTGTIINSGSPVAVFSGTLGALELPVAYDQLLPVEHFGQEYGVVGVTSIKDMYIQMISDHNDTQVTFNNKNTLSLGKNNFYQELIRSEYYPGVYINTSRPVMTTLCRRDSNVRGFLVVPSLSAGVRQSKLGIGRYKTEHVRILTTGDKADIQVTSSLPSVKIEWQQQGTSKFHVGLLTVPRPTYIIFSSNSSAFIVPVYHIDYIYSTGCTFGIQMSESTSEGYQATPKEDTSSVSTKMYTNDNQTVQGTDSCTVSGGLPYMMVFGVAVGFGCVILILLIVIVVLLSCRRNNSGSKVRGSRCDDAPNNDANAQPADVSPSPVDVSIPANDLPAASADYVDIDPRYAAITSLPTTAIVTGNPLYTAPTPSTSGGYDVLDADPLYARVNKKRFSTLSNVY